VATRLISFLVAILAASFAMEAVAYGGDIAVTSSRTLTQDDCKCISVLPIVPGVKYTVTNSCEPLNVAVQFSGDTLPLTPRVDAMSTWVRLGPVAASGVAQLGDNGWKIVSIAGVALRNKTSAISCSFLTGKSENETFASPSTGPPPQSTPAVSQSDPRRNADDELTFTFINRDPKRVQIKLYSQSRNRVWPSASETYFINGNDTDRKTIKLSCQPHEKICYGAWRGNDEGAYWGVGNDDRHSCEQCCTTCGSGSKDYTLSSAGDRSNQLTLLVRSLDHYAVELEFYANGRGAAWPGGDQVYPLKDSRFHEYTLNCRSGEKVCYGGWRSGNSKIYWGVGRGGREGCENCCAACGSGSRRWTLNGYDGSGGSSGGDVSASLDFLKNAIELGSALAGAGGRPSRPATGGALPPSQWSGRRPPSRDSDVTGTR
jgi:hypothetical protein